MAKLKFPYGKEYIAANIPEDRLRGVLVSRLHGYKAEKEGAGLIEDAFSKPIGSAPLCELAKGMFL